MLMMGYLEVALSHRAYCRFDQLVCGPRLGRHQVWFVLMCDCQIIGELSCAPPVHVHFEFSVLYCQVCQHIYPMPASSILHIYIIYGQLTHWACKLQRGACQAEASPCCPGQLASNIMHAKLQRCGSLVQGHTGNPLSKVHTDSSDKHWQRQIIFAHRQNQIILYVYNTYRVHNSYTHPGHTINEQGSVEHINRLNATGIYILHMTMGC